MDESNENKVVNLRIDDIIPNRFQPREKFDENGLEELAESIKEHGVIQPIIVRPLGDKYELIAGERRTKASVLAGKTTIPAIVKQLDDKESAKLSMLENLQRRNLSAIEEARTYKRILDTENISQEELARTMGKSQPMIANKLRLLGLPEEIQDALMNNQISERHARSLLTLKDKKDQLMFLERIKNERLTVRALDMEIKKYKENDKNNEIEKEDERSFMNNNRGNFGGMGLNDYQSSMNNNLFNNVPNNFNNIPNVANDNQVANNSFMNQPEENSMPIYNNENVPNTTNSIGYMFEEGDSNDNSNDSNVFVSHIREDNLPKVENQFLPNFDESKEEDINNNQYTGDINMNDTFNQYNNMNNSNAPMNNGMNMETPNMNMNDTFNPYNNMNNYDAPMNNGMNMGPQNMNMNDTFNSYNNMNNYNTPMNNGMNMGPQNMNMNDTFNPYNNMNNYNAPMNNGMNMGPQNMNDTFNPYNNMNNYNGPMNNGMNMGPQNMNDTFNPYNNTNNYNPPMNNGFGYGQNQGDMFNQPLNIVDVEKDINPNELENNVESEENKEISSNGYDIPETELYKNSYDTKEEKVDLEENTNLKKEEIEENPKLPEEENSEYEETKPIDENPELSENPVAEINDKEEENKEADIEVIGNNKDDYIRIDPVYTINSTQDAVLELKKTTDLIKQNKIDIETEEIDYDDYYQITIKIKKTDLL